MHPLRRRSGSADRRAAEHTPADDTARVRSYVEAITEACIDLIDLPLGHHDIQRRVIELLLHDAPEAEQAITRLNNTAVPH